MWPSRRCSGRPVRARNTSSRLGWRMAMSSSSTPARSTDRSAAMRPVAAGVDAHADPARGRVDLRRRRDRARRGSAATPGRSRSWRTRTSITSPPMRRLSSAGVPAATARPWSTITTWSASWSASSRYWVVSSTSVPVSTRRADRVPQLDPAARVEPGRGLVEQQEPRRPDQARAEVEPAAHAARVRAREPVGRVDRARAGRARRRRWPWPRAGPARTGARPCPGSRARSSPARRRRTAPPGR